MDSLDFKVSGDPALETAGELFLLSPCAGLDAVRTVICGHSHALTLSHAMVSDPPGNTRPATIHLARVYGLAGLRGSPYSPAYHAAMERVARARNVAVVWDGNQIARRFLLSVPPGIDLMPRGYGDLSVLPDADLIPEEAIRAHLVATLAPLASFLKAGGRDPALKRYVIGTHPPMADTGDIRDRLTHEPMLIEPARALGLSLETVAITPPSVRRKLWFVLQGLMAELAEEAGAIFVPVVADAFDAKGYLSAGYQGHDVTHANLSYGQAMIEQLTRYLDMPEQPTAP